MPSIQTSAPAFRPKKDLTAEWNTWRQGLNLLLRPTELKRSEMAQADNILLTGSGVPTGRWGTSQFFTAGATGSIRGFGTFANSASLINEVIALTDQGFLQKKNGVLSTQLIGQSYPSGSVVRADQLGGKTFFVSKDRPLTVYDGVTLSVFATLSAPISLTATNFSGATGTNAYSWVVTALSSAGGETTASNPIVLPNLPQDLSKTQVNVAWQNVTPAVGYQIYRGVQGDETFVAAVGASITQYVDTGVQASQIISPPLSNTTGGINSPYIVRYLDRFLFVDGNDRSKLVITGRYPNHYKINWVDGGGYIYVDPDSGRDITGIAVQPGSDRIVVYKEFSHFAVQLSTTTIGNFVVLDPTYQPISTAIGASSQDAIQTVENDIFYFGRKGLYVTGYEPNFLNLIRTNEVSARLRPYLMLLNDNDYKYCCAMYVNNKLLISFPTRKEIIVYDRERGCFAGIWKLPVGLGKMLKYVDGTGTEYWLGGSYTSNIVYSFNTATNTDDGTAIQKTLLTNKETFGIWALLKILKFFYGLFRRVQGSVNVDILIEDRSGAIVTAKSFTISGSAVSGSMGWGIDVWGSALWGTSAGTVTVAGDEITRYTQLFKSARLVQIQVSTSEVNDNFELLGLRITASSQGEGSLSSASRV